MIVRRRPLTLGRGKRIARGGRALLGAALIACGGSAGSRDVAADTAAASCLAEARLVAEQLGSRMREVSLLAPDSVVRRELARAYAPLVTTSLLRDWQASPAGAPGREVSNPWPARIDVHSVEPQRSGCRVDGEIVYVTSADTSTAVDRRGVTIHATDDDGWRVSAYTASAPGRAGPAPTGALDTPRASPAPPSVDAGRDTSITEVIRRYYAAIERGDFDAAFALWGDAGRASGQSRSAFAAGFAQTAQVLVSIDDRIAIEGAAGSQYAAVPVTIDATLRDGRRQRFEGTYTLRRSVVDGATAEQRRWRIFKADLRER